VQDATIVDVGRTQVGGFEWTSVQRRGLHVLNGRCLLDPVRTDRRLAVPGGLDDELAAVHPQGRAGEGGGVDEEQALPGDGEQPERRPDVPRAEAARVVVARQPPVPVPNCQVSAELTISAVRSGRPA